MKPDFSEKTYKLSHKEQKIELFNSWFAKDGWNLEDAACLILGYSSAEVSIELLVADDWSGMQHFRNYVEDLKICLTNEVWHSLGLNWIEKAPPIRVAQWVEDSGYDSCDDCFYNYIKQLAEYKDNSWLDFGYAKWLSLSSWTIDEAAMLLSRIPMSPIRHERMERYFDTDTRLQTTFKIITRAIEDKTLAYIEGKNGDYLLSPIPTVEWANAQRGLQIHKQLLYRARGAGTGLPIGIVTARRALHILIRQTYWEISDEYQSQPENEEVWNALMKHVGNGIILSMKKNGTHIEWADKQGDDQSMTRKSFQNHIRQIERKIANFKAKQGTQFPVRNNTPC